MSSLADLLPIAYFVLDEEGQILAPPSRFTKSFFEHEFKAGDSLFEVIFDPKSEAYSIHKTNWLSIYGEDELQFDLSIEEFITETFFEKDLNLTYTPVWSEEETIEKIIISFQDLSEIANLKSDVKQIKDQEFENNLIIRELTKVMKDDIETFLKESISFLTNSKNLVFELKKSPDLLEEIKRDLHTIKGNARMVKFDKISQQVHESETYVVGIDPQNISEEVFFKLLNEINKIFKLVSKYSSIANQVYQIKDENFLLNTSDFHRLNGKLNLQFTEGQQDLIGFLNEALEISGFITPKDLQDKISRMINSIEKKSFPQKEMEEYFRSYWQFFIQSHFSDSIRFSSEFWKPIINPLIRISSDNSSSNLETLNDLKNIFRSKELFFLERIIIKLIKTYEQNGDTGPILTYLWSIIAFVLNKSCINTYTQPLLKRALKSKNYNELNDDEPLSYFLKKHHDEFIRCVEKFVIKDEPVHYLFKEHYKKEELQNFIENIQIGADLPDQDIPSVLQKLLKPPTEIGELFLKSFIYRLVNSQIVFDDKNENKDRVLPIYSKNITKMLEYYNSIELDDPNFIKMGYFIKNLDKLPLDFYFLPLPEMTKEVGAELGKEVELTFNSDLCFIPKQQALILRDCMIHLIRNSIDHGIEEPQDRESKNKPPKAQINISVVETDKDCIIDYKDDGRGLDREKIIKKAKLSNDLSNEEVYKNIFLPSFSTRENVTVLSGRGIGMNVVYNSVTKELNGQLKLDSDQSKGFTLKIIIPKDN